MSKDETDYVGLSKYVQSKGYKRNLSGKEIESNKKSFARSKAIESKKDKKPRLHYGSVNFTASNPSYKKPK